MDKVLGPAGPHSRGAVVRLGPEHQDRVVHVSVVVVVAANGLQSVRDLAIRGRGPERVPCNLEQDLGHPESDEGVVVEAFCEVS